MGYFGFCFFVLIYGQLVGQQQHLNYVHNCTVAYGKKKRLYRKHGLFLKVYSRKSNILLLFAFHWGYK